MSSGNGSPLSIGPVCDWLKEAKIFSHKLEKIPNAWLIETVEVIVLYFSMKDADRSNIMQKFCDIYKNARQVKIRLPFEVINVPMDDLKEDMFRSYNKQAEWLTLRHNDPLIHILQYRYGITSVPHLLVMRTDGTIVSSQGILDLDEYGMNALLSWVSTAANRYRVNRDFTVYDFHPEKMETKKFKYHRKFSILPTDLPTEDLHDHQLE